MAARESAWFLHHADLLVFLVAAVARAAWVLTRENTLTWADEQTFADIGRHLAAGEGYVSGSFRANPVLPAYLALIFRVFGERYVYARLGQAILGAVTCVLVGRIGRRIGGARVGLVAGLLVAVYLPHVYLAGVFYVDVILTVLAVATVLLVMCADESDGVGEAVLAGVTLGVAVLTRPIYVAYAPAPCLLWLWHRRSRRTLALAQCALFLVGVTAVVAPWTLRNYRRYHRFALVSAGFGTKFWEGNNPLSRGDADDRDLLWNPSVWRQRLAALPDDEQRAIAGRYGELVRDIAARVERGEDLYVASDAILLPLAVQYVRDHPAHVVSLCGRKLMTLYSAYTKTLTENADTSVRNQWLAVLTFYPLLVLAAAGMVMGLRAHAPLGAPVLLVAVISVTYCLLDTCMRFRLPLDVFLAVFAALPLVAVGEHVVAKRWP